MIDRIQEVVAIANSPTTDAITKKQALDFLTQVKSEPNAVQVFAPLLNDSQSDDVTKFVALQVLADLAQQQTSDLQFIRTTAVELLRHKVVNGIRDPEYVKNKIAEVLTNLFYSMYGEVNGDQWSTFFTDMVEILSIGQLCNDSTKEFIPLGLDYFLRVCLAVNSNIGDQTFVRSKEVQLKNNSLKDTMRIQDVQTLVTIWLNTLKSIVPQEQGDLAVLTLSCIGSYISWIDVQLIVNPLYIAVIYGYLDFAGTKIACSECLCEVISKKMKPLDKLSLLSMLNLTDKVTSVGNDDLEVHEQLAKLSSSMGFELAKVIEQCNENDSTPEVQQVATAADNQIIEQVSPLVLKFMDHEYDSVTQQCFPFVSQYLSVLKKQFALGGKPGSAIAVNSRRLPIDPPHEMFLTSLLLVGFKKMRIDDSCDEDSEDEIDEFFDTIRSKLKVFQDSVAMINPALYLQNISSHIQECLSKVDWRDLELGIYQMHNLSESIRNNLFGLGKQEIANSEASMVMTKFMSVLLQNSSVFQMESPYVQVLFFELVVRHYQFLGSDEKDELALLNIFCSPFGMFNKREKVRLRTWYLFTRLIKTTRLKLTTPVLSQILIKISPLLGIRAIPPNPDGTDYDTTFDNQLYLFEGVGLLIGGNSDSNYDIIDEVLSPLFAGLETCISSQLQNPEIVLQSHHLLMAIGTLARGVHGGLVPDNQVNNALVSKQLIHKSLIEKFSNIAEVVLVSFSYFNRHENVRDASRFTFSRLIPILNSDIVSFASKLIALFLESELSTIEMCDFLGFLGQMIHMFHTDNGCYELFDNLLTPVIDKVHTILDRIDQESALETEPWYNGSTATMTNPEVAAGSKDNSGKNVVVTDSFRDKIQLKKAYYGFLQSFISNSITSLLLTERNRVTLSTILMDLLVYIPQEIQETSTIKLALNVLTNFVKCFGSGKCTDPNDMHASDVGSLEGLNEFFITKIVPLVFEIPFKPDYKFNIRDGSCRVVACDLSRLLKELYIQCGGGTDPMANPSLKYMGEVYFPQIQFPSEMGLELIQALAIADTKEFEKYYVNLINNLT
ncbi:hypothetical protein ZYGR_0AV00810 [Zygosaccharomyces rouxii]|uniref:Exportin-T n=1 Tax=Zygosaccharomyces rouxii TaxID=4956 RepID=A0A1Q3AIH3_ZYGRO|nr:hypothetical protein ZYGR_0AV00810 [Zygosaccharomyces rouxii]